MPALRSRWFAATVHAGLWLLLVLTLVGWGGRKARFTEASNLTAATPNVLPIARMQNLFAPELWPRHLVNTNLANPFFTRHFIPPVLPPPPPPTTRKVLISYQGFFQTDNEPRRAFLKVAETVVVGPPGTQVAGNLFVADMTLHGLILTNPAAQTNVIPLNTPKEVEVPLP